MKRFIIQTMAAVAIAASAGFAEAGDPEGMPHRGLSMDQVRAQYGEPISTKPAVGSPAITRWEYNGYCVYFERHLVITSVGEPTQ